MKHFYLKSFLTALLAMTGLSAFAYDCEVDGIYYNLDKVKGEATVTYYKYNWSNIINYYSDSVIIPSSISYEGADYAVTTIGDYAFYGCTSLTSVTIPNSVTTIRRYAFYNCKGLKKVIVQDLTAWCSIDFWDDYSNPLYYAHRLYSDENTEIVDLVIPDGMTSIGSHALSGCTGLTSVSIPNSVTTIGSYALSGCTGLTSVSIPNSVTNLGSGAFAGCTGLTSVSIPNSVTAIGDFAFYGCTGLANITIPQSVTRIGTRAFQGCFKISCIVVEEANPVFDSRNNCNAIVVTETDNLVTGCMNTTIPTSVTTIGNYAFCGMTGLTNITIPQSVTTIGVSAFDGCSCLTNITLPNSVTRIEERVFYSCTNLRDIIIPENVTSIGGAAFYGCTNLRNIIIPESVMVIGDGAFSNCTNLTSIIIPENVTAIGDRVFNSCPNLTSITLPSCVHSIDEWQFYGCTKLNNVTLSDFVEYVHNRAFSEATRFNIHDGTFTLLALKDKSNNYPNIYDLGTNKKLDYSIPQMQTTASSVRISKFVPADGFTNEKEEITVDNTTISLENGCYGLTPNTSYTVKYALTLAYQDGRTMNYNLSDEIKTEALTLDTQQPRVVSPGNVIVAAESNLDDEEENVGFEWRRTDWTDDFTSNSGVAYLFEGTMEGYIRNLYTEKLWKFRPYYESASGTRYYGEWVGIDPTNTSYFEPTVHTYATISVEGNTASVKGYAMRGSDNVAEQGFKYWKAPTASAHRVAEADGDIPADAASVKASGQVMTATLSGLDYESHYCYAAFVTTTEGETFYGEVQAFQTGVDPAGIGSVQADRQERHEVARYDMRGRRLMAPRSGLNIVRYSDGTVRKVMVK